MNRHPAPPVAILASALLSLFAVTINSSRAADVPDNVQEGRDALKRGDGPTAVALLEKALLAVPTSERPALLADLRQAYERAASQAEAAGDAAPSPILS